jgi:hypothetical protein
MGRISLLLVQIVITVLTHIRFKGGWHFLAGGLAGIDEINIADENEIDQYMFDFGDLEDPDIFSKVISLPTAVECDEFVHFMISPAYWKHSIEGQPPFAEGEYPYWHWANWSGGDDIWHSLRDWIADEVEKAEMMVRKGKVVYDP